MEVALTTVAYAQSPPDRTARAETRTRPEPTPGKGNNDRPEIWAQRFKEPPTMAASALAANDMAVSGMPPDEQRSAVLAANAARAYAAARGTGTIVGRLFPFNLLA